MKKNVLNYLLIAVLAVMATFTACDTHGKDEDGNGNSDNVYLNNPPKRGDVYVVGYEGRYAVTWKNGAFLVSTREDAIGKTNSIYISGKDVYEVGSSGSETTGQSGTLWKNGVPDKKAFGSSLRSVFVWNNNVYVAGGGLWKNGEVIIGGSYYGDGPNSVYVFRGNVYAVGCNYVYEQYGSGNRAWFWENNVGQQLSSGSSGTTANCVFVSEGGDVYVAGRGSFLGGSGESGPYEIRCATVWKNGVAQRLSDNTDASSVYVSGNDVYVVGQEFEGYYKKVATLWKNGVAQKLSDKESNANCVFVSGGDVYVVGHEAVAPNRNRAVLWKNGVAQYLTDGAVDASAMSVFVVE